MMPSDVREILRERLASVRGRMAEAARRAGRDPSEVTLVAVSKTVSPSVAAIAHELGEADLGESRPQELWKKAAALPGVRWHLIGHLQRNKLDRTVPLVTLIHSVDSPRLHEALDAFGQARGTPIPILLEVNCSREEAKGGFAPADLLPLAGTLASRSGVSLRGLMTMAAYTADQGQVRATFAELRTLRDQLRQATGLPLPELSMGMSNDFEIAIEEGATLVRVGSTLFEGLDEG